MRAPEVAVGDGALGFWAAMRETWPATREPRFWVHKIANILDKLPKSVQPRAKAKLHEAMNAPTLADCNKAIDDFVETYEVKYPKAAASLVDAREQLVTIFDFPAEHWLHLRTTNPIESTFATVKLRQRVTKGAGSRAAGLAMAFKLLLAAERSWRRLNGYEKLPLVRAGVRFKMANATTRPHRARGRSRRRGDRRNRTRRRGRGRSPPDQPRHPQLLAISRTRGRERLEAKRVAIPSSPDAHATTTARAL